LRPQAVKENTGRKTNDQRNNSKSGYLKCILKHALSARRQLAAQQAANKNGEYVQRTARHNGRIDQDTPAKSGRVMHS
jgi:hypothetical protein